MSTHCAKDRSHFCASTVTNGRPVAQNSFCAPLTLTYLESTLMEIPASVDSKPFTQTLTPLEATLTKI